MNKLPGAFAPLPPGGPAPQPAPAAAPQPGAPQDPAAFLAAIQQRLGSMGPPPAVPPPAVAAPPPQDPMAAMAAMAQPAQKPPHVHPPRPTKRKFQPGVPGANAPASGMTAHQMMRDEGIVAQLAEKVGAWERENPGRTLKGPHIQAMMPHISGAQARTLLRLFRRMADKEAAAGEDYESAAAYRAMRPA